MTTRPLEQESKGRGLYAWDPINTLDWFRLTVNKYGELLVGGNLNLAADIEIDGSPVLNRRFTANATGPNTLVTISSGQYMKLYKAILSVSATISGEVTLQLGGNYLAGVQNPQSGGQYMLVSAFPDFEQGITTGDSLILNLPSATLVTLNCSYEIRNAGVD
jgi:hypothetical protein